MSNNRQITGNDFELKYPAKRVFAFTPYHFTLETTLAAGTPVTITWSGISRKRYLNASSNLSFPLSKVFQSFFEGVDFGVVGSAGGGYVNSGSKAMALDKLIIVSFAEYTLYLYFDIIWGALQIGEQEETDVRLYQFGTLPLALTQTIGERAVIGANDITTGFGKEISLSGINLQNKTVLLQNAAGTTTFRTYDVRYTACVPDDTIYLRWLDIKDGYRYYLLKIAMESSTGTYSGQFNRYPLVLDPTVQPSNVKSSIQRKKRDAVRKIYAGVMSADDFVTKHLLSLNESLMQWMYIGNQKWVQVEVSDGTIQQKTREGLRQIDFEIVLPNLYNQEL